MRWWPVVPEEVKVEFRAAIVGVGQKRMSLDEALAYAQDEVARWTPVLNASGMAMSQ